MTLNHKAFEIGEEEGDEQIADVHPIHVSIGCKDDFVIAQTSQILFDVQRAHEIVHLLILIELIHLQAVDVQRLTA